jgi:hypothetical protein
VTSEAFRELFTAVATSAGALTGLLFVALSVTTPRRAALAAPPVIQRVRAAAALLAFTNALSVSLFSLVPHTNPGYPALVLGLTGVLFTAAAMRSIITSDVPRRHKLHQSGLILGLLGIFGTEIVGGIAAIARPSDRSPVEWIGYALAASVLLGVARAWELVGDRDTGPMASLAVLTGRSAYGREDAPETDDKDVEGPGDPDQPAG